MTYVISSRWANAAAAFLILVFFAAQLLTIDYGTRINDVPFVAEYPVTSDLASGSALHRDIVVSPAAATREGPDLWSLRFKLYSVEADEIVNILALARINQQRSSPDPGFYQYGGAYLYPLGLWFYSFNRLGVLEIGSLQELLDQPQRMDRVWVFGRMFVLLAFAASAVLLFAALRDVAVPAVSLTLLAIYLFCPASIMFSQVMKPHWYGLLWTNLSLLILVRGFQRQRFGVGAEILLGVALGLAVGSASTFALFSIGVEIVLLLLIQRRIAPLVSLVRAPIISLATFAITNPYYFLNWDGMSTERAATAAWFHPSLDPVTLLSFVDNSLFTGLGVALTVVLGFSILIHLLRPQRSTAWLFALAVLVPLVVTAVMTASMMRWHVNLRYVSYVFPAGLLLLGAYAWSWRPAVLCATLAATILQAAPLKLAYFDENDPSHSTRLAAAAWVDANIPAGASICVNTATPAPYEVPPFRLDRYVFNEPGCEWRVFFERETDSVMTVPEYRLVQRFRPRLSPEAFPLVFGHINPQISVYRRG